MKRLLNTLYVLSEDAYLSLDGDNVVVHKGQMVAGRFPLHTLEAIQCFTYKGASPSLMGACAERGVELAFFSPRGRFLARTTGVSNGNVLLRRRQYELAGDDAARCEIARSILTGKLFNARWVLERAKRDHPLQIDAEKVTTRCVELADYLHDVRDAESVESLMGIEGSAARSYFDVFNELIVAQKEDFCFGGRSRRPPLDRVNAMLSFGYSLLSSNYASALEGVGLDAYVGYLHSDRPGRASLALDMVEELRSVFVDRLVVSCINKRIVGPDEFNVYQDGAVRLNDEGRKAFLGAWQKKKQDVIRHPYLDEKVPWGLVPHVQAMLLARYMRGDLDGYSPFLWK